jgi:hypothetical protein
MVRRPGMPGSPPRSLVRDRIRGDSIQDVRIDDHLRVSQGRWGSVPGMRRRPFFGPPACLASSKAGENVISKVQANLAALKASARSQWSSQITELDGAVEALRTTIVGIDGNSLLSAVPTIVSDLKRIDTAWTALQQQIDQDCG